MSDPIDRQEAIDAMMKLQAEDDEAYGCHIPEGFDGERAKEALESLPSAQPEITEEEVREWCYKRCLTVIDNALYLEMRSRWSASAQSEIVRCKDCRHGVDYYHEGDCYCSNPKWGLEYFGGSWEFYCADAERREG